MCSQVCVCTQSTQETYFKAPTIITLRKAVPALTSGFQIQISDNGGLCTRCNSGDLRDSQELRETLVPDR